MATLMWMGFQRVRSGRGPEKHGTVWSVSVRRVQSKCWHDTGSALSPLLYIAGRFIQKTFSEIYCTQMISSSSGWGIISQKTADIMERCVQQSWAESKIGEDRTNVDGIRPIWKEHEINLDERKLKQIHSFVYLVGAICGDGNSPVSTRKTPLVCGLDAGERVQMNGLI